MLHFTAFSWLAFPAGVGLLGALALWRSRARPRAVPSTKLWQGLEGAAGKGGRRHVDPLWLLMVAGAILAAFCLAGPEWAAPSSPVVPVQWAVRSVQHNQELHAELWVQWKDAPGDAYALRINETNMALAGKALREGTSLPVTAKSHLTVQLKNPSGRELASETFQLTSDPGFAFLTLAGAGNAIDPAIYRAFAVQPGAVRDDPTRRPAVLLINAPAISPTDATLAEAQLVIAEPDTPLPGIEPGEWQEAPLEGWEPIPVDTSYKWPRFVSMKTVRIHKMREATFSSDWQILATAGGHPWQALRTFPANADNGGKPRAWLWIASEPGNQTDWPADPSFVLFFAELKNRFVGENDENGVAVWSAETPARFRNAGMHFSLASYFGALAMALLVSASLWYIYRASIPSERA